MLEETEKPKKKRKYVELGHQIALVYWFRMQYPKYAKLMTLGSYGEKCTPARGEMLKKMGLTPGHADLVIFVASKGYHGLHIEMKRKGGKLADSQKEVLPLLVEQNYCVKVCYSFDEGKKVIDDYFKGE